MLKLLRDYLRLVLFCAGVLAGIQVPGFVDQYHKSLQAHLAEAQQQLAGFQRDADRYFNGDLQQLIAHYANSNDPVFSAGGVNLQQLAVRHEQLAHALARFNGHVWQPYQQIVLDPIADIRQEVWQHYSYQLLLKPEAIIFGLLSGLLIALLIESLLSACFWCIINGIGRLRRRPTSV
ncbi:DUF2937 family protein [Shewanella sp. A3A]|uniref:DUF2937 family protein n=1 Tax=Shewanella electrica TaxID=515560 RepID=A0ABT2FM29_9GAMM|nr:DUF2937 family protein [Shewanella electrica]MCH1921196.1 DUF2937 family protein [Shewanella ferrihydritica]MCH1925995.1 DUF2937 family protein [Shewanella electrica]MCS4557398.1 DUF2937 family protein [Shewanella electrica]